MTSYQVSVAAESLVASLLSQSGYDVSVQYGANQPGYDLVAVKPGRTLQVSVKGSQDGGWVLTAGRKEGKTYHEAADGWLAKHGADLVFAFVQFEHVKVGEMPRVYFARANEVAAHLKSKKGGTGDTRFSEFQVWKSGMAKGITDKIPDAWKLSKERIDSV
jgi:Holliday junction resolvase-like predicted endonuclease